MYSAFGAFMNSTLLDLYSRETFRDVGRVFRTCNNFDYSPIVFIYENAFRIIAASDGDVIITPLIAAYMLKLLQSARKKTNEIYPDFLAHKWITGNGYFKKLVFTSNNFSEAKSFFWKELQESADSGTIKVCESVVVDTFKSFNDEIKNRVTLTALKTPDISSCKTYTEYKCDTVPRTWKWNDIKDYFVELNTDEIALLNGKEFNFHTKSDEPLFKSCSERNLEAVKKAINNGANVNSINEDGETPLSLVLSYSEEYDDDFLIRILDYLLEKGADINLFGFGGMDCITCAHLSSKPKIMEYLFEHGAGKDLNCYVTDLYDDSQWFIQNAAYDYCITDRLIGDYYDDNCKKQIDILEKYGVSFFIDGWNAERLGFAARV